MIKQFIKSLTNECWNIGFIQNSLDDILEGEPIQVKWMKHTYKKSWFADPFILNITDTEIHLLVEEFYKPRQRGRISHLILDINTYELKKKKVILELETHLSFPAIFRDNDRIFIYPENGESGELYLYQFIPETNVCFKVEKILSESVADAIITRINNKDYLFCTKQPNPNGNSLYVYEKKDDCSFIAQSTFTFCENVARMAGNFIEYKNKIIRPAQECNTQYGHGIVLQEVVQNKGFFSFNEIRRLYSTHPKLNVGMHTFNLYKGVIVTDALGFENMWIRNILKFLKII